MPDTARTRAEKEQKKWNDDLMRVLTSLSSEEANEIVQGGDEQRYKELIAGTNALVQMGFALAQQFGMRKTKSSIEHFAKHQLLMLQIVHIAYALGLQEGRK